MPLSTSSLNNEILSVVRKYNSYMSNKVTQEINAYSSGLVNWFRASTFKHDRVTGTAPSAPGQVRNLKLVNGKLVAAPGAIWVRELNKVPTIHNAPQLSDQIEKSVEYLKSNLKIECIDATGLSTAAPGSPPIPGILSLGKSTKVKLTGISGSDWAKAVSNDVQDRDLSYVSITFDAIIKRIKEDITMKYLEGSITGAFPKPNAALVSGIAVGGQIL
jgi:hypothetical protein